jgi:hypothetical protein
MDPCANISDADAAPCIAAFPIPKTMMDHRAFVEAASFIIPFPSTKPAYRFRPPTAFSFS